jgi:toxin HigB-1
MANRFAECSDYRKDECCFGRIWFYKSKYLPLALVTLKCTILITAFADKETEKIWNGDISKKFPQEIQQIARRKLRMLNNALNINDLRVPPSNHLEKLIGDLAGYHSIRINKQWRIIFKWSNSYASGVKIVDYH